MSDQLVIETTTYPTYDKHKRPIPISSARFESKITAILHLRLQSHHHRSRYYYDGQVKEEDLSIKEPMENFGEIVNANQSLVETGRWKRLTGRHKLILKDDNESNQYKISYTKFNKHAHSCFGDITFRERRGVGNKRVFRNSVSHKLKRTKNRNKVKTGT